MDGQYLPGGDVGFAYIPHFCEHLYPSQQPKYTSNFLEKKREKILKGILKD